jgi:azurin
MHAILRSQLATLLTLAALTVAGCGQAEKTAPASALPAAAAAPGVKTLQITGDDMMKFNVTLLEAKAGEPLRVTFTNIGKMPKQAMAHNWVLLQPCSEADLNAFGTAAAMAAPTHIPPGSAARIIAQTRLLGPGESESIDFKAPSVPGEYPFLCTFPGHFALMKGKLVVK